MASGSAATPISALRAIRMILKRPCGLSHERTETAVDRKAILALTVNRLIDAGIDPNTHTNADRFLMDIQPAQRRYSNFITCLLCRERRTPWKPSTFLHVLFVLRRRRQIRCANAQTYASGPVHRRASAPELKSASGHTPGVKHDTSHGNHFHPPLRQPALDGSPTFALAATNFVVAKPVIL